MIKILARLLTMRTMRGLFLFAVFLGEEIMGKKLKRHLPIDGQIAKLSSRGLIIEEQMNSKTTDLTARYRYISSIRKAQMR